MLFKILWDFQSRKNNLWIQWIHTYYLRGKDVWLWSPSTADHPLFKKIAMLRDQLIVNTSSVHHAKQKLKTWFKDGKFCPAQAYDWLRVKSEKKAWMSFIWKSYIPPKFSFILWLALRDKLNTKNHWIFELDDSMCVFCKNVLESTSHLFFNCTFVKAVWYKFRLWLNIHRSMSTLQSSIKWIKKEFRGNFIHNKTVVLAFAATVYTIWNIRNKVLFTNCSSSTDECVKLIKTLVLSIIHAIHPPDGFH